jgi:hypothetical protein
MNLNEQLSNIRAIKAKVEDEILKRSGIVGVDIGYKEVNGQKTGELAIRKSMTSRLISAFPLRSKILGQMSFK